jgi:hypothetical protein
MKGTLKLENGKELTVEIDENTLKSIEKPRKTGYERVEKGEDYYLISSNQIGWNDEQGDTTDQGLYNNANYYSNKTIAENNFRADTLMRKLRRFAVEHREKKLDWNDDEQSKYYIEYSHYGQLLEIDENCLYQSFGKIYFDTIETAEAAINEFKDELLWYFTEYRDSL